MLRWMLTVKCPCLNCAVPPGVQVAGHVPIAALPRPAAGVDRPAAQRHVRGPAVAAQTQRWQRALRCARWPCGAGGGGRVEGLLAGQVEGCWCCWCAVSHAGVRRSGSDCTVLLECGVVHPSNKIATACASASRVRGLGRALCNLSGRGIGDSGCLQQRWTGKCPTVV